MHVDIVMPTYNRWRYCAEAIRSIQAQTHEDWRLVVADDGSTDETPAQLSRLADRRIHVVRHEHDGRLAVVRNHGFRIVAGSNAVAYLDDDDRWRPDHLTAAVRALNADAAAGWCYSRFSMIDEDSCPVPGVAVRSQSPVAGDIAALVLETTVPVCLQTTVLRGALVARLGTFDERIPLVDDYDYLVRAALVSRAAVVSHVTAEIREHRGRTTAGRYDQHLGKAMVYRKVWRSASDRRLRAVARRWWWRHLRDYLGQARARGELTAALRRVPAALWRHPRSRDVPEPKAAHS